MVVFLIFGVRAAIFAGVGLVEFNLFAGGLVPAPEKGANRCAAGSARQDMPLGSSGVTLYVQNALGDYWSKRRILPPCLVLRSLALVAIAIVISPGILKRLQASFGCGGRLKKRDFFESSGFLLRSP